MSQNRFTRDQYESQDYRDILKEFVNKFVVDEELKAKIHRGTMQYTKQRQEQSLETKVDIVNARQLALESRVNSLEFHTNISQLKDPIEKIESFAKKLFFDMPEIINLSYKPTSSGLIILAIHNFDDTSTALTEIQKNLFKLEDAFPTIYIEPWILHVSEVQKDHLNQAKTIFQR